MRRVQRFICDECKHEWASPELAIRCEKADRKRLKECTVRKREEKYWQEQGHDVWVENGKLCHAERVDPHGYGPHNYGTRDHTTDCGFGCKCWMGPANSGGPVDPFGACPKNPCA